MERVESLSNFCRSGDAPGDETSSLKPLVRGSTPPPSPLSVPPENKESLGNQEEEPPPEGAALEASREVRRSPRIAMEVLQLARQQQEQESRKKVDEGEVAARDNSVRRSRLVTPAKPMLSMHNTWHHNVMRSESKPAIRQGVGGRNDQVHWHSDCTASPARGCPHVSVMPLTPDSGNNDIYKTTQHLHASPFDDYLERKYNEIFQQGATPPLQLPTLLFCADAVTAPLHSRSLKNNEEVGLFWPKEGATAKQEDGHPDEYAPIDLARTSSTEIYESLLALDASFKSTATENNNGEHLATIKDTVRISPDPVCEMIEVSTAADDSTQDDAIFPTIPNPIDSAVIPLSGDSPAPSLERQTSFDHFLLFHQEADWTDHIMNIESVAGMRPCHEDTEPWNISGVLHDHRYLTVVPSGTSRMVNSQQSFLDTMIKPQARLCNHQARHENISRAPTCASIGLVDDTKQTLSSTDRQESAFLSFPDILAAVAASAKKIQKTKTLVTKKKTKVNPKKTKKSKQPQAKVANQTKRLQSKQSETVPPSIGNDSSKSNGWCLANGISDQKTPFKIQDAVAARLKDQEDKDDSNEKKGHIVKKEPADRNDRAWHDNLKALKAFHRRYGHTVVPSNDPLYAKLFNWMKRQRHQARLFLKGDPRASMNKERLSILQSMDFVFDAVGNKWEERFCLFKNFMKKYGSYDRIPCPKKLKREDFSLEELTALNKVRMWIRVNQNGYTEYIRGLTTSKTIDSDRIRRLEEAGFEWTIPGKLKAEGALVQGAL